MKSGDASGSAHNAYAARQVFGEAFIAEKRAAHAKRAPPKPDVFDKVHFALCEMGFRQREVKRVLTDLRCEHSEAEAEPLLRAALSALTPATRSPGGSPSG
jgi:Holliday junction resolvasome RuvABC DNA-binding subunit